MEAPTFTSSIQHLSPQGNFANMPPVDFKNPENSDRMHSALAQVAGELGREYDLVINGHRLSTATKIRSINPARPAQLIGLHQSAGAAQADAAMNAALSAFELWRRSAPEERASLLLNTARIIRIRYFEFCAWMVYEVGKNWAEAAADASEAVDFLEFYAREALRLAAATPPIQFPGERDELLYVPLGVGAVISPWNFPFAIMAGMTAATIVTGNTVILKPSSDAPTIAAKFFEVLEEAGMPAGVVNFCPGSGTTFGNAIVEDPRTRFIAFTGSKAVGLGILEKAARTQPGQIWIKRTILEMGGKNAIIVAADADLDKAVEGVVASAFGYSGQKCSACSRAIIEAPVYEEFTHRLTEKVTQLKWGDPAANPNLGPVINQAAAQSIQAYIETGKKEGQLIAGGRAPETTEGGYFIEPTVFADVAPSAVIAQEEIFGPVLALIKAENFEQGLNIANQTGYGLTGSVYSTDREKLNRARREFHVGNLYFNRKCTGAMVGAHPFGGFNMSGTDSKAGGPDYLSLFMQAKSIGEKL